jgi:hypothetical protein
MLNARLKKTPPILMFVALYAFAGARSAWEMTPFHLITEVSNITYQKNDDYLVEVTIANRSGETVVLREYEASFSAQSEILGQWIDLGYRAEGNAAHSAGLDLPAQKESRTTMIMSIPLSDPHLYRNHEGDVNVRFRYRLKFSERSPGKDIEDEGEGFYWITPRTDRWVLREGM